MNPGKVAGGPAVGYLCEAFLDHYIAVHQPAQVFDQALGLSSVEHSVELSAPRVSRRSQTTEKRGFPYGAWLSTAPDHPTVRTNRHPAFMTGSQLSPDD